VPADVVEVGAKIERLLDEADAFCREGTLLTLAASDDVVAFRRWYLGELTRQVGGAAPQPWPGDLR
jgi:hypothetical protein